MKTLDDLSASNTAHWLALPKWVRIYVFAAGIPAWLILMTHIISSGEVLNDFAVKIAVGFLASAGALQIIFWARSYWRMDL